MEPQPLGMSEISLASTTSTALTTGEATTTPMSITDEATENFVWQPPWDDRRNYHSYITLAMMENKKDEERQQDDSFAWQSLWQGYNGGQWTIGLFILVYCKW